METTDTWTKEGQRIIAATKIIDKAPAVKVGILSSKGASDPKDERRADGTVVDNADKTLAEVAVENEFGTKDLGGNIPERSYIRSTVDRKREDWAKYGEDLLDKIIDGKVQTEQALGLMGLRITADIQATIRSSVPPENAPSTIARKGSSTTLVDLGQLVNGMAWEVIFGDHDDEQRP